MPHATEKHRGHRQLVAAHFESTVPRWEEFYTDRRPSVYATIYKARLDVALARVDELGLAHGSRCLDVGCGPGIASVALAQRGFHVDAIDIVAGQLARTRGRAVEAQVGERVATSIGDVHELEFPDGAFELVFVIGVLEWLKDPGEALRQVARVLKPGGYAVVSVDNKWALRNIMDPFMHQPFRGMRRGAGKFLGWSGLWRRSQPKPRDRAYSIRRFDRLVADTGLAKVNGATLGFGPFPFLDLELPRSLGLPLHHALQHLADRNHPLLRSAGLVYLSVGRKGREPSVSASAR